MAERGELLWNPPADVLSLSKIGRYMGWLRDRGMPFASYAELWRWSVDDLNGFWGSLWEYFAIDAVTPAESVLGDEYHTGFMPGRTPAHRWFHAATLNYATHALRGSAGVGGGFGGPATPSSPALPSDELGGRAGVRSGFEIPAGVGSGFGGPAIVAHSQTRGPVELSIEELRDQVARCRAGLERLGVRRGDRVAAYLPNIPEAIVAFLATASLGAIWSSCAPEFGTRSVLDRLRQIEPTVLLAVDGYQYGAKRVDRAGEVAAIRAELPTVRHLVTVPYLDPAARFDDSVTWDELLAESAEFTALPVPFDHPLYILYSSGTTGLPKPIVHGHGGILLEHYKALALHCDLGPGDPFFWFSTTGWMMWNFLVSGLLVGSTVVLFDGDPGFPDLGALWRLASAARVTFFGTSAPFLLACRKAGLHPAAVADLSAVRTVGSTGAPLPPEGFRWVYDELGGHAVLSSISGGTDVCTAFVGGCPLVPVRSGEISCRYLGAKVEAFDETGEPVVGEQGELVISAPLPSMPVGFWGDVDGSRYRAAYFEGFPGVWTHGDWITVYDDGACVITGRSDATLNRGGVRMGTAELYSVVEAHPEVADSLVIHLEDPLGGPGRLLLFVALAEGAVLDDALRSRLVRSLRTELSPRHVPDEIHAAPAIPRTLSGKKLEIPVKRILTGTPPHEAASPGSLANPTSLTYFTTFT